VVDVVDEIGGRGHLDAGTRRDFAVDRLLQQEAKLLARLRDDHVFLPQARQRQFAVRPALRQPPECFVLAGMMEGVAEVAQPGDDVQRQA
jgi:hypothetical protein